MSVARGTFLRSLAGIKEAIALESLAQGSTGTAIPPGVFILRRGILVAGLIALEAFVRDRTAEALRSLERWPMSYEDLPEKLRVSARLNALSHLQQFAKMLKRQGDDYELELKNELIKMASGHGSVQQFTKYVAGDYTGNLSDGSLKGLLSSLQVHDCWTTFRVLAADIGIGVPSVQEICRNIVIKRHRSAHAPNYTPTPTEIAELPSDLLCVAICFDISVTSSMEQALASARDWSNGDTAWRTGVTIYVAQPYRSSYRLFKHGTARALRVVTDLAQARTVIPRATPGTIAVLIEQNTAGRPTSWDIL